MTKSKLCTLEAILLVLSRLIPLTVISLPKTFLNELKSSSLLNIIYITLIAIFISFIIYKLFEKFLGNDILDISNYLGGTIFKNIIGTFFIIYFLVTSAIILRDFCESLCVVYYPYTDVKYIILSFIFTVGIVNNFGFGSSIMKTTVLIFPVLILNIILLFLGNIDNFSFHRIFPILGEGFQNTFILGISNLGAFSGICYLYFLPPLLKEPKDFKKVSILSSIFTGLTMFICIATLLLMFSIFVNVDEIMPLFTASRYIEFGTFFQRFESIFLLIWIISFCCYLVISCRICTHIFGKMLNLKDSSQTLLIFIILLYVLTLLPKNYSITVFLETNYFRYFTLFIIFIGFIVLLLGNFKSKKSLSKGRWTLMQSIIKQIFIVILLIFCIVAFSGSYVFFNIDNLAFVVALGLDVSETNNVKVTFQFVNLTPNNQGSNDDSKVICDSVEASSIPNAINIINSYLDKKVDLSHCKTIIFSEDLAKKDITDYIYSLMNDVQVRPSSNVIVCKCDAKNYMNNSQPSLETSIVKFYQNFPKSSNYTGYVSDTTIGEFFNTLVCNSCEAHTILGALRNSQDESSNSLNQSNSNIISGNSPISAVRRTENFGIAVFKHGTLVGELDVIETACYHILKNDINSFLISIPNPEKEGYLIDVYIIPKSKPKINVSIINGSPYIKIDCKLSAKLASISENSQYLNNNILDTISNTCNNYIQANLSDFLYKTSLELKSDVNGIGNYVLHNFTNNNEFFEYNWQNNFKNSTFDVTVKTNIDSSYFITQT